MPHNFKFQVSGLIPPILKAWLPLALFSILWLDLIRQLSYMWETSEQYAFGWFVPFFALALLWRRWLDRPVVSGQWSVVSSPVVSSPVVRGLVVLCAALLLPLRLIHEVNQDWALFSWLLTLVVVALTLYAFHLAGPPPSPLAPRPHSTFQLSAFSFQRFFSPWVLHFAFPICFILVAVRWPYRLENSLTYRLMGVVTTLTVELLGWLNVPTVQHGHLIEVATGTVGVDEACSGIRSFQSSLMAGLLMGELYRLRLWARASLVGVALLLAFSFNVLRTLILTWQANAHGLSAIDKWHDSAGMTITVACFFSLWALALLITKWTAGEEAESRKQKAEIAPPDQPQVSGFKSHPSPDVQGSTVSPQVAPSSAPQVSGFNPQPSPDVQGSTVSPQVAPSSAPQVSGFKSHPSSRAFSFLFWVGLWSLFCILATEAWYRSHESKGVAPTAVWWAQFPTNLPSAREIPISKLAWSKLKYDQGTTLAWEEPDGGKWTAYCFRWNAGVATSRMSARDHRPEFCLGGSGYNCQADFGIRYLPAHGLELPFRTYIFDRSGLVLYVFHCIWEDGAAKQKGFGTSKYLDRLETVLEGKRCLGQQTLEIIVSGYPDMTAAEAAVRQRLPSLIQPGAAPDKMISLDQPGER